MSRMSLVSGLTFIVLAMVGNSASQAASIINFDPNGTAGATSLAVGQFDQAPGNALAVNAIANGSVIFDTPFELLYQAKVAALRDANNNTLVVPGVDTAGELTIVARFNEIASGTSTAASFSTNTDQTGSFIEIYFDPGNNANDLAGTGFNDGTLIYRGTINQDGGGGFAVISTNPVALDQSPNGNQYSNLNSVTGAGGTLITVDTEFQDSNFFLTDLSTFSFNFNTSNVVPFSQVDPAAMMFDGTPAATLASLGAVNGLTGPNFLFQADATASFAVIPEPTSSLLLSVGLVGMVGYRIRSRRSKVA
ncbi:PEP-CTERM sorting domain-containing protein [Tautonia plasticadhaerens]|uniref:PEP-CTERM protein-sorting domain-containing protein n=1 Tax=Tautonia plasticadhaerens TaxID=2527974 RepID=A0A518H1N9_9BACT|nr:PEP-CTERM sorting domain-containing protein [Tautonia plasticadhaerens]QDV34765.1 hypothetical protein ElP_26610 [Tautonia plasticadhaerens]